MDSGASTVSVPVTTRSPPSTGGVEPSGPPVATQSPAARRPSPGTKAAPVTVAEESEPRVGGADDVDATAGRQQGRPERGWGGALEQRQIERGWTERGQRVGGVSGEGADGRRARSGDEIGRWRQARVGV